VNKLGEGVKEELCQLSMEMEERLSSSPTDQHMGIREEFKERIRGVLETAMVWYIQIDYNQLVVLVDYY